MFMHRIHIGMDRIVQIQNPWPQKRMPSWRVITGQRFKRAKQKLELERLLLKGPQSPVDKLHSSHSNSKQLGVVRGAGLLQQTDSPPKFAYLLPPFRDWLNSPPRFFKASARATRSGRADKSADETIPAFDSPVMLEMWSNSNETDGERSTEMRVRVCCSG